MRFLAYDLIIPLKKQKKNVYVNKYVLTFLVDCVSKSVQKSIPVCENG